MNKIIALLVLVWASLVQLNAQYLLSLEDAMNMAVQHDFGLKNQALKVSIADKELDKVRAQRNPVISGSGDARYNPLLQTVVIPGEAFGQPGDDPQKVRFGTNFNLLLSVDASYKALDPAYRTQASIQTAQSGLESITLKKSAQDVKLDAATAYFDMALQQTQVEIALERLSRARDLLAVTQTRMEAGAVLPVELTKSELDVQNAEALLEQARNNFLRSRLLLARRIGKQPEAVDVPQDILQLRTGDAAPPTLNPAIVNEHPEMAEAAQRLAINQLQLQLQDKRYLPALELYGNITAQHLSDNLSVWSRWFPFAFVGVRATVPIFDGNLKALNKESIAYQLQIDRNQMERIREDLTFELQSAAIDMENAIVQLRTAERNRTTAVQILQSDQVRFKEGALPFADFRNSEFALRESEGNYLAAAQNYLLARLRWMRAGSGL